MYSVLLIDTYKYENQIENVNILLILHPAQNTQHVVFIYDILFGGIREYAYGNGR
jgi:hypothetical protein